MRHALVFGGTGQIGYPLLGLLRRDGWRITAVSRQTQPDQPGLHWLEGDLGHAEGIPGRVDA
ncbi:MAG TPA: NAD-dependent epimerase/dehydratase family protein, partial [Lysobacter sp.]